MVKNKKAAMEMSVGTIVTIVLLMTVLILGLVLVKTIFKGSVENINSIDTEVKNQINKLFAEDSSRKIVVYPPSRQIILKKGTNNAGFGFAIRNVGENQDTFSYEINAVETSCGIRFSKAEDYISLGKSRSNLKIPAGSVMRDPIFVRFNIPETAPPCQIRYQIQVYHEGKTSYNPPIDVDIIIKSE